MLRPVTSHSVSMRLASLTARPIAVKSSRLAVARILLECALAAGMPAAASPALDWLARNHVDDAKLQGLAAQARAAAHAAGG